MDLEQIKKEAYSFFEWPSDNKHTVTTTSAILFAHFIAKKSLEEFKRSEKNEKTV